MLIPIKCTALESETISYNLTQPNPTAKLHKEFEFKLGNGLLHPPRLLRLMLYIDAVRQLSLTPLQLKTPGKERTSSIFLYYSGERTELHNLDYVYLNSEYRFVYK